MIFLDRENISHKDTININMIVYFIKNWIASNRDCYLIITTKDHELCYMETKFFYWSFDPQYFASRMSHIPTFNFDIGPST